jgi:hypothetical protein
MLCAMPDSFFSSVLMDEQSFKLPPLGDYAVGMVSRQLGTAGPLVCFLGGEEGRGGGGTNSLHIGCCQFGLGTLICCMLAGVAHRCTCKGNSGGSCTRRATGAGKPSLLCCAV